ncbi:MAG: hypothetical protein U0841_21215 [Chloroflexia bacterium]
MEGGRRLQGWANPLTITMNADYSVEALYATPTIFPDVPEGRRCLCDHDPGGARRPWLPGQPARMTA